MRRCRWRQLAMRPIYGAYWPIDESAGRRAYRRVLMGGFAHGADARLREMLSRDYAAGACAAPPPAQRAQVSRMPRDAGFASLAPASRVMPIAAKLLSAGASACSLPTFGRFITLGLSSISGAIVARLIPRATGIRAGDARLHALLSLMAFDGTRAV